jgi:nicotinamidase-related amidase
MKRWLEKPPFSLTLIPMKVLIVIDIQNDYFAGGKMELVEMAQTAENAKELISSFRRKNTPVIFIQHLATKPNASFFIPGTFGAEIHESIRPLENETVIVKNFPNSFRSTNLNEHLKSLQADELVLCGAMTHMCIDTSVRAAFDLGYSCTLISDACATRDLQFNEKHVKSAEVQTAFLAALHGTFANVVTTDQYLKESEK